MKIIVILFCIFVATSVSLSIMLQPNDFLLCPMNEKPSTRDGCDSADAIVAVSGGDTAARTKHAIALYENGWAPLLVFSGAAQDKSGPSNAKVMYDIALASGVPAKDILIEEASANTNQNAEKTNELLKLKNIDSVILVTSGYHQLRASLEFKKTTKDRSIDIRNSPAWDKDWQWWWWATPRGWWLASSEFVKVIAFYAGASQ